MAKAPKTPVLNDSDSAMGIAPATGIVFDNAVMGSVKNAMSDAGGKSADLWMVPYESLRIDPAFNVRIKDEKYEAKVEWLKGQMMLPTGFLRECPLAGYIVKEDGADVIYITGGHRRYEAAGRAIAEGAPIERIPVIAQPPGTNIESLTVKLVTENNGEPLSPYEVALVCQRLIGYGLDEKTIAQRLGYTVPYIKQLFELLSAPKAVRDMVTAGKVSASLAVKTVKKHGKEAAGKLKEGLKTAESKGKKKVTSKHVEKSDTTKKIDHIALIKELVEYVKMVRVGDDAADLIARADAVIAENEL